MLAVVPSGADCVRISTGAVAAVKTSLTLPIFQWRVTSPIAFRSLAMAWAISSGVMAIRARGVTGLPVSTLC